MPPGTCPRRAVGRGSISCDAAPYLAKVFQLFGAIHIRRRDQSCRCLLSARYCCDAGAGGRTSKASVPCWYYSKLRAAVKFQLIISFHSSPESHDQHARQQRRIQCGVRNGLLASCSCACKTGGAGRMEQHLLDCRDEGRESVRESCARPGRVYSWLFWFPLAHRPFQGGGSMTRELNLRPLLPTYHYY